MTNDKTEAAEMEKLLEELQDYNQSMILSVGAMVKETVSCGRANFATALISAYPKLNAYIRTLQSQNRVLEEEKERMRAGLEFIANTHHEESAYLDSNGQVMEAQIAKNVLESLHDSPDSV